MGSVSATETPPEEKGSVEGDGVQPHGRRERTNHFSETPSLTSQATACCALVASKFWWDVSYIYWCGCLFV